jgi:hypothetical protein
MQPRGSPRAGRRLTAIGVTSARLLLRRAFAIRTPDWRDASQIVPFRDRGAGSIGERGDGDARRGRAAGAFVDENGTVPRGSVVAQAAAGQPQRANPRSWVSNMWASSSGRRAGAATSSTTLLSAVRPGTAPPPTSPTPRVLKIVRPALTSLTWAAMMRATRPSEAGGVADVGPVRVRRISRISRS